jgi:ribosomal protein L3 glutamine methyltransferase
LRHTIQKAVPPAQPDGSVHLTTARGLIKWGEKKLAAAKLCYGHGTRGPLDEAVYLVFSAVGLAFYCDDALLDRPLTEAQIQRARAFIIARIKTRKPAAYIAREAWFAGLGFYVDERVLVPRSPIAELIEAGFSPWIKPEKVRRILDIGTGSGCIAIACALAFPEAQVDAVDVSPEALDVAQRNVDRYQLRDRIELVHSDLFEGLQDRRYDLIVSNPPYVPTHEIAELPIEYLHEPSPGLAGGHDGLAIIKRLLVQASKHLTREGILVVEVGDSEAALVSQYPHVPFLWLDFERGGEGVFLLERSQLKEFFG